METVNLKLQIQKFVMMIIMLLETVALRHVLLKLFIHAQMLRMHSRFVQINVEMTSFKLLLEKFVTMAIKLQETDVQHYVK